MKKAMKKAMMSAHVGPPPVAGSADSRRRAASGARRDRLEAGMSSSFARQLSTLGPNTLFVHKWKWAPTATTGGSTRTGRR